MRACFWDLVAARLLLETAAAVVVALLPLLDEAVPSRSKVMLFGPDWSEVDSDVVDKAV